MPAAERMRELPAWSAEATRSSTDALSADADASCACASASREKASLSVLPPGARARFGGARGPRAQRPTRCRAGEAAAAAVPVDFEGDDLDGGDGSSVGVGVGVGVGVRRAALRDARLV